MKKILIVLMVVLSTQADEVYQSFFIKENGKKVEVKAKKSDKKVHITKDGKKFDKNVKIIIKFDKEIDIQSFCQKYNLQLEHKMITGHYIFVNNSGKLPMELIEKIIKNEKGVVTALPNWRLNQKKQ